MRGPRLSDERGIALAVAVFALVIIGALVAGTFFSGRLEERGGINSVYAAQAFEAAEAGVSGVIGAWEPDVHAIGNPNQEIPLAVVSIGGNANLSVAPSVTRLNDVLFLVRSEGRRTGGDGSVLASRLVGSLVRIKQTEVDIQAAVTGRGVIRVGGNATVDGNDHVPTIPADWDGYCPPAGDPLAGIRTDQTVDENGGPVIAGDPRTREHDSAVVDSIFTTPFEALVPLADIIIQDANPAATQPATTGLPARCDRTNALNWGEPWNPAVPITGEVCQSYLPIIYRAGNLKLQGGRGQGILLVKGDLELSGGVEFYGIVIVDGRLKTTGNGNKVNGAVMARNVDLDDTFIGGTPVVNFSSCAVTRALQANAKVVPLGSRSWAQLF